MIEIVKAALEREGFIVTEGDGGPLMTIDGEEQPTVLVVGRRRGLRVCVSIVEDDRIFDAYAMLYTREVFARVSWLEDFPAFLADINAELQVRHAAALEEVRCAKLKLQYISVALGLEEP